jgi:DNA-binding YbaB/EbfC family protein
MSNGKGGGKMPDLGALMKQAQKLQADVQKAQEELALMTVDGAAGGGMVTVTVNGQHDVVKIKIDKTVVDPSDIGMLEDLVTAAINQANAKVREISKERMSKMMGGMPGMPGLF